MILRVLVKILAALCLLFATAWATGVIVFAGPFPDIVAKAVAIVLAVIAIAAIAGLFATRLRPALYVLAAMLGATTLWWAGIRPSNDRQWQQDVAVQPWAEVDGDKVTFHNVRNLEYRTETDFTPHWEQRTYDLAKLDEVDLAASYWMGNDIAHLLVSFGFGGEDFLAISIETRKEVGESYSTLAGFFRRYELYYVVADERDLIGVRTNIRQDPPEDVYLYRTKTPRENVRRLFLDYVREINSLREHPEFYNTLTTNCTTSIWFHTMVNQNPGRRFSWKILASGHTPEYVYDLGRLDSSIPFEELRERSHIDEVAKAAGNAPDFSQRIRANLPRPASTPP